MGRNNADKPVKAGVDRLPTAACAARVKADQHKTEAILAHLPGHRVIELAKRACSNLSPGVALLFLAIDTRFCIHLALAPWSWLNPQGWSRRIEVRASTSFGSLLSARFLECVAIPEARECRHMDCIGVVSLSHSALSE